MSEFVVVTSVDDLAAEVREYWGDRDDIKLVHENMKVASLICQSFLEVAKDNIEDGSEAEVSVIVCDEDMSTKVRLACNYMAVFAEKRSYPGLFAHIAASDRLEIGMCSTLSGSAAPYFACTIRGTWDEA